MSKFRRHAGSSRPTTAASQRRAADTPGYGGKRTPTSADSSPSTSLGDAVPGTGPMALLLVGDVADRLRISEREVRRWIAAGRLPVVRFGRAVRIRPADLAQLIA